MGLTYDRYIRTTDPEHKRGVQKLFAALQAAGAIYKDTYTGQYCVSDEAFVDVSPGAPCPDCGRITETISETNYYFRLSQYQQPLLDLIESNQLFIQPEARRNEVLSFLRGGIEAAVSNMLFDAVWDSSPVDREKSFSAALDRGVLKRSQPSKDFPQGNFYDPRALKDLSISRTSFKWGIPVPGDEEHVIYVWLDALANYMTALGYGSDAPEDIARFEKYWPADLHIVGKEIIRFHCVYWPAFLLAAGLPLPKQVVAHGWLLFEESKMSKSRGNIVRTETILDALGPLCPPLSPPELSFRSEAEESAFPDATDPERKHHQDLFAADVLRYFLLREIPFGQDGSFSFDALITRYNADLANGYGNLVSRTLNMIQLYFDNAVPNPEVTEEQAEEFYKAHAQEVTLGTMHTRHLVSSNVSAFTSEFDEGTYSRALISLGACIGFVDIYINAHAPWKLAKETAVSSRTMLGEVLYTAAESIRIITALLYPILPLRHRLGLASARTRRHRRSRTHRPAQ